MPTSAATLSSVSPRISAARQASSTPDLNSNVYRLRLFEPLLLQRPSFFSPSACRAAGAAAAALPAGENTPLSECRDTELGVINITE
jgi:hypothetical protein